MAKNNTYILQNGTILVKNLKGYKYSGPEDNNIRISGTATYKDGKQEEVDIMMNFERAIRGSDGLPPELLVPEEFRTSETQMLTKELKKRTAPVETKKQLLTDDLKKIIVADEIKKLFDLYKAGALTKAEYESQKRKLLQQ